MAKGKLASKAKKPSQKVSRKAKRASNQKSVKQPTPHTKRVASLTNHGETNSPIFTKGHTMKRLFLLITLALFSLGALTQAFAAPARNTVGGGAFD